MALANPLQITKYAKKNTAPVLGSSSMTASVRNPLMSDRWLLSMFDSLNLSKKVPHGESHNFRLASSFEMKP